MYRNSVVVVPLVSVARLEVAKGSWKGGAAIGAGIGAFLGAAAALGLNAMAEERLGCKVGARGASPKRVRAPRHSPTCSGPTKSELMLIVGAVGAGFGATVGAESKRWEEVPLPLSVDFSPRGGARVALRFEFGR